MREQLVPDPRYPCAFQINQAWQIALGRLSTSGLDARDIAPIFDAVPRPISLMGALLAAYRLNTFFLDFARAYDCRFHRLAHMNRCTFDRDRCYEYVRIAPDNWSTTDVGAIVRRWVAAFDAAFTAAHGRDVAALGSNWCAAAGATVRAAAQNVACSPATFRRRFKARTGKRPIDARTQARVVLAVRLLLTTDWKVTAIAAAVGWKSAHGLYDAFATWLGKTPDQVRALPQAAVFALLEQIGHTRRRQAIDDRHRR